VLYLAMRYVEGLDLRTLLAAEKSLPHQRAAKIVAQAAEGLDAAHRLGLVHRDVKPANILLAQRDGADHVYVTDFGLTKHQDAATLTGTRGAVGTAGYMAPEQARGERVDARADVYSLGCVLFELLTGQRPYPRESLVAQMYAHAFEPVPRVLELAPGLPEGFDLMIQTAMAKEPDERYRSAGDLGRAARAVASGEEAATGLGAVAAPARGSENRLEARRRRETELQRLGARIDPPLPMDSHFAGYRMEALVGVGGAGAVYRATHLALGRMAAVELLKPDLWDDATFRERFKREARLAASLDHPNVIPIYAADESDSRLYIAMRYVDGPTLEAILGVEGRLAPQRAAGIVAQVAAALDAAHTRGLIHGDPKPGNVLTEDHAGHEHAYLSEFGLASRQGERIGRPGEALGSVNFMAPEQIRDGLGTAASDIYALGCVLYECLTGRPPFSSRQGMRLLWAHLTEPPPSVRESVPALPESLDEVVRRAMSKEPGVRYPSAGDLADAALAAAREAL
jgi:serine/threonine protein kinase